MMDPTWQAIIGVTAPIVVITILVCLTSYFDNGWVLGIGFIVYFVGTFLLAWLVGQSNIDFVREYPFKNICFASLIQLAIMFVTLHVSAFIEEMFCSSEGTGFVSSFIVITIIVAIVSAALISNHIKTLDREFVETDEVVETKYELSSDEDGKFIYYASKSATEEGYYLVIYKENNEFKTMKIKESKLSILDSVESDEKNFLIEKKAIHKKQCTNDDSFKTETKVDTTYMIYVPGGAANIGFVTAK